MGGGTEAFPDLGSHCQNKGCNQLDFLPFVCEGCRLVFCVEHRSYKSHECPKSDHKSRKVIVCEKCSTSIETTGKEVEDEASLIEKHEKSRECDPSKKKKQRCPVPRCKESLTFSNTAVCKSCQVKVCLRHRFPTDHSCKKLGSSLGPQALGKGGSANNGKFLAALTARMGKDCGNSIAGGKKRESASSPPATPHSVKAC